MPEPLFARIGGIAVRAVILALIALGALGLVRAVGHAVPPRSVVIETGPIGGSYYRNALLYKQLIEASGVHVEVRPNPESLQIIDDVDAPGSDVEIGFTAQYVDREKHRNSYSAGIIEVQPLFTFYNRKLTDVATPHNFLGRRVVVPQANSASADAALRVLSHYGVTPETATIEFMAIGSAVQAMKAGRFDVGFFMLAPNNELISSLVTDAGLQLLDYGDAPALSRLDPSLTTTVIRRGIFDLVQEIPERNVTMLGGAVNVVVKKTIHPAILYLLLDALSNVHRGASLVSDAGTFPALTGTALPIHPLAKEYEKSGTPWVYRNLPLSAAGPVDYYFAFGVAQFLIIELIKSSKYVFVFLMLIFEMVSLRALHRIESRRQAGHRPSRLDELMIRLTDRSLSREQKRLRAAELLQKLKGGRTGDPRAGADA
jgi:TRAP-type uncharacterized transport system substrate-binding protein